MDSATACILLVLLPFVGVPIAAFSISRPGNQKWFEHLDRPRWGPTVKLFPVFWTVVYACIGYASCRYYDNDGETVGWIVYAIHLALNWCWPPIFWILKNRQLAYMELVILFIAAVVNTGLFWKVDLVAGLLLIPDLLWLIWLLALSYFIYINNNDLL
jgi:benzodiazapine receptor